MDHYSIAFRWAAGSVPRNGLKGHHVFCNRETIYSYGYHFPLATRRKGCILVNADKCSVSTTRHQGYVRRNLCRVSSAREDAGKKGLTMFTIPRDAWSDKKLAVSFYREKVIDTVAKWDRSRVHKDLCMADCRSTLSEFRCFCEFHKIDFDRILKRDTKLALSCAIIALNPGG
jgi:hypothetical protein